LEAILPEFDEDEKETPAGFALVGHVGKQSVESLTTIAHDYQRISISESSICHTDIS
jgi:hypothetical protein